MIGDEFITKVHEFMVMDQITADQALSRMAAKLASSHDEFEAALGLFLQRSTVPWDLLNKRSSCDQYCMEVTAALGARQAAATRDTLIEMASRSENPRVYGLALISCGYRVGSGAEGLCASLSADQWARLEPDNGVPWLLVASASQAANDAAGRDAAIYRASTARRFDAYYPNLLRLMQLPDVRNETPEMRSALVGNLLSIQIMFPSQPYSLFFRFCNYPSVADPNRIDVCGKLTNLLIENDHTMLGFASGVRLAQSADRPPEEVASLRERKKAYFAGLSAGFLSGPFRADAGCEALARLEHWAADYAQLGDLGAAKKYIEENGYTVDKWGRVIPGRR